MAEMQKKLLLLLIFAVILLQAFAEATSHINAPSSLTAMEGESEELAIDRRPYPRKINCGFACSRRCMRSSRKKMCHRACKSCCLRCRCVPPGTYGNLGACPCYASLRTHGNRRKCP